MEIPRKLQHVLQQALATGTDVHIILGARRVGKSHLLNRLEAEYPQRVVRQNGELLETQQRYVENSLESLGSLAAEADLLMIDEAQAIPHIGLRLKLLHDHFPGLRIVATGSSAFDLTNHTGEPLVGRAQWHTLHPISQIELAAVENAGQTATRLEQRLIYGSYPRVILEPSPTRRQTYLKELVVGYLLKDVLVYEGVKNSGKMLQLLQLLALQLGHEVSLNELSKSLGIARATVEKMLDLLSKVFVIHHVPGYSGNHRKEVTRMGRWYFTDNGIRNALLGNFGPLETRADKGALWENYLISERLKAMEQVGPKKNHYFWRTTDQQEVDWLEEDYFRGPLHAFEFKWGNRNARAPRGFTTAYPEASFQVIEKSNYLPFVFGKGLTPETDQ